MSLFFQGICFLYLGGLHNLVHPQRILNLNASCSSPPLVHKWFDRLEGLLENLVSHFLTVEKWCLQHLFGFCPLVVSHPWQMK